MFEPGRVLNGRYRIDAYLEHSEPGDIYLAADLRAQMPVTLRMLVPELAAHGEFLRRLQQLTPELANLGHPAIARFFGLEHFGGDVALVTEYVPGRTLQRRLLDARGALPLDEATSILEQVAGALADAHRHGVVHGSLQPANVVLESGPAPAAFVENLGLAMAAQQAGLPGTAVGNPAYLSPEQLVAGELSPASDVYSLGVILYEMATGAPPFTGAWGEGATQDERLAAEHLALPPLDPQRSNPGLPPAAAAVILRALAKQPAERWQDPAALAGAWRQALPVGAAPAALSRPVAPPRTAPAPAGLPAGRAGTARNGQTAAARSWTWPLIALALALLSIGLLAWFAFGRLGGGQGAAVFAAGSPRSLAGSRTATPTAGSLNPTWPGDRATASLTQPAAGPPQTPAALPGSGPTPAPGGAYAITLVLANVRAGPGTDTPVVGSLDAGTRVAILGRSPAGDWWQICCVNNGPGWVFANLVSTEAAPGNVPVTDATVPAPASATAVPSTPAGPAATPAPQAALSPSLATGPATAASPAPPSGAPAGPSPSPSSTPCPPLAGSVFAGLPAEGLAALGCVPGGAFDTHFSHQFFQNGQMIYRYDQKVIYVLYADGAWAAYPDVYVEGQPWQQGDFTPPAGLKAPIKGFDRVWERPDVRAKIGWATRDELGVIPGQAADFQRGLALRLDYSGYLTGFFVLLADGHWRQY